MGTSTLYGQTSIHYWKGTCFITPSGWANITTWWRETDLCCITDITSYWSHLITMHYNRLGRIIIQILLLYMYIYTVFEAGQLCMFSGHSTADQLHVHDIPTHRSFLVHECMEKIQPCSYFLNDSVLNLTHFNYLLVFPYKW